MQLYVGQQVDVFINRPVEAASVQPVPPEQRRDGRLEGLRIHRDYGIKTAPQFAEDYPKQFKQLAVPSFSVAA